MEKLEAAKRLHQVRKNLGITQQKFAEILDISLSAYKKMESAENCVSINSFRILKKELGVSVDYILFGEQPDLAGLWKKIVNCTEKDKLVLLLQLYNYFSCGSGKALEDINNISAVMNTELTALLNKADETGLEN